MIIHLKTFILSRIMLKNGCQNVAGPWSHSTGTWKDYYTYSSWCSRDACSIGHHHLTCPWKNWKTSFSNLRKFFSNLMLLLMLAPPTGNKSTLSLSRRNTCLWKLSACLFFGLVLSLFFFCLFSAFGSFFWLIFSPELCFKRWIILGDSFFIGGVGVSG